MHPWEFHGNAVSINCPLHALRLWGQRVEQCSAHPAQTQSLANVFLLLVQLWSGCSLCSSAPLCFYSMTWGFRCCTLWKEKQFGVSIEFGWYYGQSLWNPAVERHCREMNQNWVQRASAGGFCSHQSPVNISWSGRVQESRDGAMGCAFLTWDELL